MCKKNTILSDVTISITPTTRWWRRLSMEEVAAEYESWVKEFKEFLRDHRSQDVISLDVVRVFSDHCSACGKPWEPDEGTCAWCGEAIE